MRHAQQSDYRCKLQGYMQSKKPKQQTGTCTATRTQDSRSASCTPVHSRWQQHRRTSTEPEGRPPIDKAHGHALPVAGVQPRNMARPHSLLAMLSCRKGERRHSHHAAVSPERSICRLCWLLCTCGWAAGAHLRPGRAPLRRRLTCRRGAKQSPRCSPWPPTARRLWSARRTCARTASTPAPAVHIPCRPPPACVQHCLVGGLMCMSKLPDMHVREGANVACARHCCLLRTSKLPDTHGQEAPTSRAPHFRACCRPQQPLRIGCRRARTAGRGRRAARLRASPRRRNAASADASEGAGSHAAPGSRAYHLCARRRPISGNVISNVWYVLGLQLGQAQSACVSVPRQSVCARRARPVTVSARAARAGAGVQRAAAARYGRPRLPCVRARSSNGGQALVCSPICGN